MFSSDNDSLAFDEERPEQFIPKCPWMKVTKIEFATETERELSNMEGGGIRSRDIGAFAEDDALSQYVPGEDFVKTCNFIYVPNKLFNLQIFNENEQY